MIYASLPHRHVRTFMIENGLTVPPLHYRHNDTTVIFCPDSLEYLVIELDGRTWWTNDLPLVIPEILTPGAAINRAERYSKCRGAGKCYAWCRSKHGTRA